MRSAVLATLLTTFAFFGCGCLPDFIYNREFVEPDDGADLRDMRVLVVPFREKTRWYGESETGRRLSVGLEQVLRRNCYTDFLGGDDRRAAIDPVIDSTDPTIDWQDVARRADVDAIVVGDVTERHYGQKQIVGMLTGRLTVLVEVWRRDTGLTYSNELTSRFPKDPEHGEIAPSFEESQTEVETKLIALTAKEIGDLLCGYEGNIE